MPIINSPTADATTTTKGKVQLAGDLAGTAATPVLSSSAIKLGTTSVTTTFTTTSATPVQVTGLTLTATVPSSGRDVELLINARSWQNTNSLEYNTLSLWEGTVGSGTKIYEWVQQYSNANQEFPLSVNVTYTPTSGSKTWNVGLARSSGTASINYQPGIPIKLTAKNI